MRASEFITEQVSAKQVFDTCYGTACKLYDEATKKGLEPKLLQVAGYKGKTDDADPRWKKLPPHVWQHYVVVIDDKVLDPSAKQFGNNMPTKYSIDQLSKNWDEVYTIRPKSLTEDENGKLAWRIRFRRFKDLSPLMPERENKIYLMPTDHSALRTFGNLTGKDDEKITKMPTEAYMVSGDARVGDMSIINAIHRELQTTKDQDRIEKLKKLYLNTSVPYSQYRPGIFKYPEILAEPSQLTKLDKSVTYNKNTGEIDIKDKANENLAFEAQMDDVGKFINNALQKAGYKFIGSGYDAQVWMKDEGTVVKILMPESQENEAIDSFKSFYNFVKKNPSPNLPVFKKVDGREVYKFTLKGKPFMQFGMEQLYPIQEGSLDEWVVWMMADLSAKGLDWANAKNQMGIEDDEHAEEFKAQNASKMNGYKSLYETLLKLYKAGMKKGYGWDPHTENVMKRSDGTLVITDPWSV